MNKITTLLFLFLGFSMFSQEMKEYPHQVKLQENNGIEYTLHSEIIKKDIAKKRVQYQFALRWTNTTDQDIYFLVPGLRDKFGEVVVPKNEHFKWDLKAENTGLKIGVRKVYVLKAGKTYEHKHFTKWVNSEEEKPLELLINIKYNTEQFANSIEDLQNK